MSTGSRGALVALLVLAATAGVGGTALASPAAGPAGSATTGAGPAVASLSDPGVAAVGSTTAANTTMVVQLRENGDARWSVTTHFNLSTQNETEAFRDLAAKFEAGDASALGLEAFRRARDEASTVTGREMLIREVSRSAASDATVSNGTGWLRLSFTWTNFARVEDNRLTVGDAFRTADGVWLRGLAPDQRLVMHAPEGWGVLTSNTTVNEATLVWNGPTSLDQNTLSATFTGSRFHPVQALLAYWWVLPAALVVVVGLVLGYLFARRRGDAGLPGGIPEDVLGSLRSNGGSSARQNGAPDGATDARSPPAEATTADEPSTDDGVDLDLLSDEERVERLLERNGGRMKQANIVKETGWSNAKVSQLLSSMDADDRIDKLRIGRENLISFPDEDVTDVEE
ncbi:helix-turn-helix transcriptional regulator [Halobacteriales archaeon Cl-PHB]